MCIVCLCWNHTEKSDVNFRESYKILNEKDYINKILDRFNFEKEETKEQMSLIRKRANDYIDNQTK